MHVKGDQDCVRKQSYDQHYITICLLAPCGCHTIRQQRRAQAAGHLEGLPAPQSQIGACDHPKPIRAQGELLYHVQYGPFFNPTAKYSILKRLTDDLQIIWETVKLFH
jgi:hypothetical protein